MAESWIILKNIIDWTSTSNKKGGARQHINSRERSTEKKLYESHTHVNGAFRLRTGAHRGEAQPGRSAQVHTHTGKHPGDEMYGIGTICLHRLAAGSKRVWGEGKERWVVECVEGGENGGQTEHSRSRLGRRRRRRHRHPSPPGARRVEMP